MMVTSYQRKKEERHKHSGDELQITKQSVVSEYCERAAD